MWNPEIYQDPSTFGQDDLGLIMDLFHKTLDISKNNCFATGWGKDRFGRKGEYKTVLKQVQLGMLDFESCEEKLRETRLTRFFELDKSFTCAGGNKGVDLCTGDGGGPLVCPKISNPDQYVQVSIYLNALIIFCDENFFTIS